MGIYVVQPGDSVDSIAAAHGYWNRHFPGLVNYPYFHMALLWRVI